MAACARMDEALMPAKVSSQPRISIITPSFNQAAFIEKTNELGRIAPGYVADLTIVDGDPLKLIFNLMNVGVVVQGGKVVVDHR